MQVYIAFLRGINVGGHRKIKMLDLREALKTLGLKYVQTYIQSGNIIFKSNLSRADCIVLITKCIKDNFGLEVPVLVLDLPELMTVVEASPFSNAIRELSYYTLLANTPNTKGLKNLASLSYPEEEIILVKKCIYFYTSKGMGKAKYSNNIAEKLLKVNATTRNHRTLNRLVEMAQHI